MIVLKRKRRSNSGKLLEQYIIAAPIPEKSIGVCWGITDPDTNYLNHMPQVNGLEQLKMVRDVGIKTPDFTTSLEEAQEWAQSHIVFGRNLYHQEGRDIVTQRHRNFSNKDYWVKYIPNIHQEWRFHIFQGKSIARGLKVRVESIGPDLPICNRRTGWRQVHNIDPPRGLRSTAKEAVEAVGYHFGAVDLAYMEDGTIYFFEVNKAPGLSNYTAEAYTKAIMRVADELEE